ncbi:hypothetical protein FQN57_000278 [Myotisia sp. PD_48]|nr:hypothetical protein FQN57_000278 [Myotisia sp. PD_48]
MQPARLRKAFRYPDSPIEEDQREDLDDQEQEALIERFHGENERQNTLYLFILFLMPCLATIAYIPTILSSTSSFKDRLASMLAFCSLVSTAVYVKYGPISQYGRKQAKPDPMLNLKLQTNPMGEYILWANGVICLVVAVVGYSASQDEMNNHQYMLYLIPLILLISVVFAHNSMASVDVEELARLRYVYKGA